MVHIRFCVFLNNRDGNLKFWGKLLLCISKMLQIQSDLLRSGVFAVCVWGGGGGGWGGGWGQLFP